MSTDISIQAESNPALSFDDFTREHLPLIARSVRVLARDPELADAALARGLTSVFHSWPQQRDVEQAQQHVFGEAVHYSRQHTLAEPDEITPTAIAMAHHVFGWNTDTTIKVLGVTADDVFRHVGDNEVGERLRHQVDQAEPAQVDLPAITKNDRPRKRSPVALAIGIVAALLALGAVAQFVASPARTEQAQDAPPVSGVPFDRPTFPGEAMELEPWMLSTERFPDPSLIAPGVSDGFVGVRQPTETTNAAVFFTSTDGLTWQRVGSMETGFPATVDRFERVGTHFVTWSTNQESPFGPESHVTVSQDLAKWTPFDLDVDERRFGLRYESQIIDIAISGDVVLALFSTDKVIDAAPLGVPQEQRQPQANRLFISRDSQPFENLRTPFGAETDVQLKVSNGEFVIADSTGLGFATSTNGQTWRAGAAQQPPFPVQMSTSNDSGQVLGLGERADGETALFFNNGPNTTTTQLNQIVADATTDATALVVSTPNRWVLYVYEPGGQAWIAASDNGLNWNVANADAPTGSDVGLVASDYTAIVQTTDASGETSTTTVVLPAP